MRRAALIATAVAVPVVVVLLVLINVFGPDDVGDEGDSPVAEVSGQTNRPRDDSPVPVDTPPITTEADAACPALMSQLPLELADNQSRRVDSDSPFAYAWGDPAQVLICGVAEPELAENRNQPIEVNGVGWSVDTTDPAVNVWTTIDRSVPIQLQIPSSQDGSTPTLLSPIIADAIPAR